MFGPYRTHPCLHKNDNNNNKKTFIAWLDYHIDVALVSIALKVHDPIFQNFVLYFIWRIVTPNI